MPPDDVDTTDADSGTPPQAPAAPPQSVIPVADLSDALASAYQKITLQNQPRHTIQDPIDGLSMAQREQLNAEFISDPVEAYRKVSRMGADAERQRMMQQAIPLFQSQANTIVELYKTRKQRSDTFFQKIEPLFDALMVGVDTTPLVNMNEATRNRELDMRWKMARADVLDGEMKRQKPEPLLTAANGPGPGGGSNNAAQDAWIENMKREYNFTDDQIKDILGAE